MKLQKTIVVGKPINEVFAYLSDFTTTTQWDPGTETTVLQRGDGGVGTTYLNTSVFLGRKTQLTYTVREFIPERRIQLRGENKTVTAVDTMNFRSVEAGTEVTYAAEFTFSGPARLVAPLLWPAFERLGNQAEVPHAFRTTGTVPVRFLALTVPGQLLDIYDEVGVPAQQRRLPDGGMPAADVARWIELAPRYGLRIVGPPIPGAGPAEAGPAS